MVSKCLEKVRAFVRSDERIVTNANRKEIFRTFGEMRIDLEEEMSGRTSAKRGDEARALYKEMDSKMRKRLRVPVPKQSTADRISAAIRCALTLCVGICMCIVFITFSPLRWTHPAMRRAGIQNGRLPMDWMIRFFALVVLAAAGIKVVHDKKNKAWANHSCGLIVANHCSNLDPFVLALGTIPSHAPKFVGKKILFAMPFIGWVSFFAGMVPINRGDRTRAIESLNLAVNKIMLRYKRSVALFMEGTRTRDGNLILPFKKGSFHMQKKTKAPLLPAIIRGTYALWPPGHFFCRRGRAFIHYLPAVPYADTRTIDASRIELQRTYLREMYAEKSPSLSAVTPLTARDNVEHALILACFCVVTAITFSFYAWLFAFFNLDVRSSMQVVFLFGTLLSAHVIFFV